LGGTGTFILPWASENEIYYDNVDGDNRTIKLPPLQERGNYTVHIHKIQDVNGCLKDLGNAFTVDVRRNWSPPETHEVGQEVYQGQ
jgi:hypothetical protein